MLKRISDGRVLYCSLVIMRNGTLKNPKVPFSHVVVESYRINKNYSFVKSINPWDGHLKEKQVVSL